MSDLEKKVAMIARIILAEDPEEVNQARENLLTLMNTPSVSAESVRKKSAEEHIRDILLEVGAPDHLIGHKYLVDAIMDVLINPTHLNKVTYSLYPVIAQKHDTVVSRVDRNIRHVVETAFERGDLDVLKNYFGNTVSPSKSKPTNSEFIARIANIVRNRLSENG